MRRVVQVSMLFAGVALAGSFAVAQDDPSVPRYALDGCFPPTLGGQPLRPLRDTGIRRLEGLFTRHYMDDDPDTLGVITISIAESAGEVESASADMHLLGRDGEEIVEGARITRGGHVRGRPSEQFAEASAFGRFRAAIGVLVTPRRLVRLQVDGAYVDDVDDDDAEVRRMLDEVVALFEALDWDCLRTAARLPDGAW